MPTVTDADRELARLFLRTVEDHAEPDLRDCLADLDEPPAEAVAVIAAHREGRETKARALLLATRPYLEDDDLYERIEVYLEKTK